LLLIERAGFRSKLMGRGNANMAWVSRRAVVTGALLLGSSTIGMAAGTDDDRLEQRIEARLERQPALAGIRVDVENGTATLAGAVASTAQKQQAESLARTSGAKRVDNQLEIDAHEADQRSLLRTKLKAKMAGDSVLRGSDIEVETGADGVVTLWGTVPSDEARTRALELARTTEGVRRVYDEMAFWRGETP
jgi:osmotically-inducible protein OsmY